MSIADYLEDGADYYQIYGWDSDDDCDDDCLNCIYKTECEVSSYVELKESSR